MALQLGQAFLGVSWQCAITCQGSLVMALGWGGAGGGWTLAFVGVGGKRD